METTLISEALSLETLVRDTLKAAGIYVDKHGVVKPGEAIRVRGDSLISRDTIIIHQDDAWEVWRSLYAQAGEVTT